MPSFEEVFDALALLTPYEMKTLSRVRIGNPDGDGGYVLADRFRPGQKVYSYGVFDEVSFDLDLAERGLEVFLYDHTIARLVADHPNFTFIREGVAGANNPAGALYTIDHHIQTNGHDDNDMILKMDIEGMEWGVIEQTDASVLRRFEQMVIEMHSLTLLDRRVYHETFMRALTKLLEDFHIVHVHANNAQTVQSVCGLPVPYLLEVTLIRKDIDEVGPWQTVVPTVHDTANIKGARPDLLLNFFPFLPNGLSAQQLQEKLRAALKQANGSLAPESKEPPAPASTEAPTLRVSRKVVAEAARALFRNKPEMKKRPREAAAEIAEQLKVPADKRADLLPEITRLVRVSHRKGEL